MSEHLTYIINHVFLPPELPHEDDSDPLKDIALVSTLLAAVKSFQEYSPPHPREHWKWLPCTKMLEDMLEMQDQFGGLDAKKLQQKLQTMSEKGVLTLWVRRQNAGLIVRRFSDQISFESFELAPTNEAVTQTRGRLLRSFPGPAVAIRWELILDPHFGEPLVEFLVKLDGETPEEVQPIVMKSGSKTIEPRDTVHPRFITEMLTGFLRAVGQPLEVPRINKCTREDVLWDNAYMPWQRSPLWLLLRVALQTTLVSSGGTDKSQLKYKSFMIFFMSRVLGDALKQSIRSDFLFAMTAKIGRRALKLGLAEQTPWLRYVETTVKAVQAKLTGNWNTLEEKKDPFSTQRLWRSSRLNFKQDTKLKLSTMLPYLKTVDERHQSTSPRHVFTPTCPHRIHPEINCLPDSSLLGLSTGDQLRLCLADLELWVFCSLPAWLSINVKHKQSCTTLKQLIDDYTATASRVYSNIPEEMSIIFLTTMELWVALDKCALHDEPILQDYNPEFPPFLFEPLLLPKKHQMERLLLVEQYLIERKRKSKPFPSVFRSPNKQNSLSVRYFNQSSMHQNLRRSIEADAASDRSAKILELEGLKREYERLIKESERLEHTYYQQWVKRQQFSYHSSFCRKCTLDNQARSMDVYVHEWPLPEKDLKARAAVFELDVPTTIAKWRDATYTVLTDVLGTLPKPLKSRNGNSGQGVYFLHDYDGLSKYFGSPAGRLQLGSITKSFLVAHYRHQKVSQASEESICKNHNLRYKAYDSTRSQRPPEFSNCAYVHDKCTPKLPSGPLQIFQYTLDKATHTSNDVIASQSQHPVSLTLHESYAFATLRSGHRLQWRNIARELTSQVLNFNRNEIYVLITQAAWQIGPLGKAVNTLREAHVDLAEEEFTLSLASVLEKSFDTIEANWQSASAARTYTALAARVLSLSPHESVRRKYIQLLRKTRAIALLWMRELSQKLQDAPKEEETKILRVQTLEMALTCHESFDVELEHLPTLLKTDEDIATMTECSIAVHDHCPAVTDGLPKTVKALLPRYWRRMHHCEPGLRKYISQSGSGLDSTVQRLWAGYRAGVSWTALEKPNERWLATTTANDDNSKVIPVHYNLLDGTLLVNGSPLTRLPRSYEADPSYCRVFGEGVLNVIPTSESGMLFETREKVFNHQVYFGMHNSKLIIRAKKECRRYELIPIDALCNDFPSAFIEEYVHWLDVDKGIVEWRPLTNPWDSSNLNWWMRPNSSGSLNLARDILMLIDLHTPTAKALTSVLSPLEQATHLHATLNDKTELLEVHLPRLKLDFFSKKGILQLESKQYRGMVVDEDQSFGALTGLVNKLVLRGIHDSSRIVIIPYGEAACIRDGQHVRVHVASPTQPSYHMYSIDRDLGRLVDNGSLKSKFFLCYLHAITSNNLPDQLTSRTGTEEALSILRSASAQSFLRIEEEEIKLLEQITQLTPIREYYPPGLQVMHRVRWTKLPPLSQHHAFDGLVRSIICLANTFKLFEENPAKIADLPARGEKSLLKRAAIRNSTFCVYAFGAEDHVTTYDAKYEARDTISDSNREFQVYRTAKLVNSWSRDLQCTKTLLSRMIAWRIPVQGISDEEPLILGFDLQWLVPPTQFLPAKWCTLQTLLSTSTTADRYKIMLFLSTLSYSQHRDIELVETLLAFATVPELRRLQPPQHTLFDLSQGFEPQKSKLLSFAQQNARPFYSCPESELPALSYETWDDADARRRGEHCATKDEHVESLVDNIVAQWPASTIHAPSSSILNTYINMKKALEDAQNQFNIWHHNVDFKNYVNSAQNYLNSLVARPRNEQQYFFSTASYEPSLTRCYVDLKDLLCNKAPSISPVPPANLDALMVDGGEEAEDHRSLELLLASLSSTSSAGFEQRYLEDLSKSFTSLHNSRIPSSQLSSQDIGRTLQRHLEQCEMHLSAVCQIILDSVRATSSITLRIAFEAKLFPRLSQVSLLRCLANNQEVSLDESWKACLIGYGESISKLQRARRLLAAIGNITELRSELCNPGRQGWDAVTHPDWLLLEIENNLCIRNVQAQIAQEMIAPSSGANSVMQLNMGEGKSSVIVPIVAAALADQKKLVRVVVLKPLAPQMFQSLVKKLGGLLNRRVFYMPFSRSIRLDVQQAMQIRRSYEECMATGGVLLTQPEHLLSFELMGPERLLSSAPEVGKTMFETQRWLDTHCRDILDESDEILSVRFELIYTMGEQAMIEFGPDRWVVIEHILGLIRHFVHKIAEQFPEGLEVHPSSPGSFPRIRILQPSVGERLTTIMAEHICDEGIPGLPMWNRRTELRKLLLRYLTDIDMTQAEATLLQVDVFSVVSVKKILLLLRGLIAGRILAFAFEQKRWRVNYGLDLSRTMLSVPYRAKDIPAARAEFSHPDTTIVLTCLSYYYGGLSDQELHCAFETLLLSDQAQDEYDRWVQDAPAIPDNFRQLAGINLSDHAQCQQRVFPCLRLAKAVIDFYMSRIVFPREMQEFSEKLSSSGWDIAKTKNNPITGFSGTNDSRYILPLSVSQSDLPEQLHTNAAVLECLLRTENTFQHSAQWLGKGHFDAESLLSLVVVSDPPVRVILDVGAQVLELTNEQVARSWLGQVDPSKAQAVIYFNTRNELSVMSRDWTTESFLVSPFAKQMDQCLVYLDESHTRGTDLKLPTDYRAAVTLGPDLSKDRLVQACMRMRKLGKGQSVMFCAPKEVERKILRCTGKSDDSIIEVADVLRWSIRETCISTKKCVPLWAIQGVRHQRRQLAWPVSLSTEVSATAIDAAKGLLEPEAKSLEERYGFTRQGLEEQILLNDREDESFGERKEQVIAVRDKCHEFGIGSFSSAKLQEEQERELSPEAEKERQVERPLPAKALEHTVHPDVKRFVHEGILDRNSTAFQPAFGILETTSAGNHFEKNAWSKHLVVTRDFARTIEASGEQHLDEYLRPVHWIATSRHHGTARGLTDAVILSPYEANELLPSIRSQKAVTLHIYSPRVNLSVRSLEDLSFCAVPPVFRTWFVQPFVMELNLFAGQLYLSSHDEYLAVCQFLGLSSRPPKDGVQVQGDGFVRPADRAIQDAVMARECLFQRSPVEFLRILMALRRKGQDFKRSHMGGLLHGELLAEGKFD